MMSDRDDTPKLTRHSPFYEVVQYLGEKYYHKKFSGTSLDSAVYNELARFFHGVLHACSTVKTADLMLALVKKYNPFYEILIEPADTELHELFRYAAFCHDIGNIAEIDTNNESHPKIYSEEMLMLGYSPEKVELVAKIMLNKDSNEFLHPLKNALQSADALEILRTLKKPKDFILHKMEILQLLNLSDTAKLQLNSSANIPGVLTDSLQNQVSTLNSIVFYYYIVTRLFNNIKTIHLKIEHAKNCYIETEKYLQAARLWAELQSDISGDLKTLPATDLSEFLSAPNFQIPIIELYDLKSKPSFLKAFKQWLTLPEEKEEDLVLQRYNNHYLFIRNFIRAKHKPFPIDEEFHTVHHNKSVLKEQNISEASALKERINQRTLPGYFVRPITCVAKDLSLALFQEGAVGLIFDPQSKNLLATHFFKDNVESHGIVKSNFSFARPNSVKSLSDIDALLNKLREREARRRGQMPDSYNRHYGSFATYHNEVWADYDMKSAIGISIGNSQAAAKYALYSRLKIFHATGKVLPFYQYDALTGFTRISQNEVLDLALFNIKVQKKCESVIQMNTKNIIAEIDPINAYSRITSLKTIASSIAQNTPSITTPATYEIEAEILGESHLVPAKAFYIDQFPVISLNINSETKVFYDHKRFFPRIIKKREEFLVDQCNVLLKKLKFHFKNAYQIEVAKFTLFTLKPRFRPDKRRISLEFREDTPRETIAKFIAELLGYSYPLKEDDFFYDTDVVIVKLRMSQGMERVFYRLKSILSLLQDSMLNVTHLNISLTDYILLPTNPFERMMTELYLFPEFQAAESLAKVYDSQGVGLTQVQFSTLVTGLIDQDLLLEHWETISQHNDHLTFHNKNHFYKVIIQAVAQFEFKKLSDIISHYAGTRFLYDNGEREMSITLLTIAKSGRMKLFNEVASIAHELHTIYLDKPDNFQNFILHYFAIHEEFDLLYSWGATAWLFEQNAEDMRVLDYWTHPLYCNERRLRLFQQYVERVCYDPRFLEDNDDFDGDFYLNLMIYYYQYIPITTFIRMLFLAGFSTDETIFESNSSFEKLLFQVFLNVLKRSLNSADDVHFEVAEALLKLSDCKSPPSLHMEGSLDTPLHLVLQHKNPSIRVFQSLLDRNDYSDKPNQKGVTIRHLASNWATKGNTAFLDALDEKYPLPNAQPVKRKHPDSGFSDKQKMNSVNLSASTKSVESNATAMRDESDKETKQDSPDKLDETNPYKKQMTTLSTSQQSFFAKRLDIISQNYQLFLASLARSNQSDFFQTKPTQNPNAMSTHDKSSTNLSITNRI